MIIYIIPVIAVLISTYTFHDKRATVICFLVFAWLLLAVRDLNMGMRDTLGTYYSLFQRVHVASFSDLINGSLGFNSILFTLSMKLYQMVFGSYYQGYIALNAFFILGGLCIGIIRNNMISDEHDALIVCIAFYAMLYPFMFTLIRQYTAIAVLFAASYPALRNRNKWGFLISTVIAGLVHSTALIVLLLYPCVCLLRFSKRWLIVVAISSLVGILLPEIIIKMLDMLPFLDQRMRFVESGVYGLNTQGVGYGSLLLYFALLLYFVHLFSFREIGEKYNDLVWMLGFAIIFQAWSHVIVEFYRVSMYFSISIPLLIVLMPWRKNGCKHNEVGDIVVCLMFLMYFYSSVAVSANILPYAFASSLY